MTDRLTKRRKFLQSAGVSGTALLAGCTGFFESVEEGEQDNSDGTPQDDGEQTETNPTETNPTETNPTETNPTETDAATGNGDNTDSQDGEQVGIMAKVDQEAIQEIQVKLQNEEIDSEEANEQQDEILQEAIDAVVTHIETTDGVAVDETFPKIGAVLATGAPVGLIGTLNSDAARALLPAQNVKNAAEG